MILDKYCRRQTIADVKARPNASHFYAYYSKSWKFILQVFVEKRLESAEGPDSRKICGLGLFLFVENFPGFIYNLTFRSDIPVSTVSEGDWGREF